MAFSNSLKEVARLAKEFASFNGAQKVETEHLLYGVLAENSSLASKYLNDVGVDELKYKKVILSYLKNTQNNFSDVIDFSNTVNSIFAKISSFYEKNTSKQQEIELLLLFVLQNKNYKATKLLENIFKIDIENLKNKLSEIVYEKPELEEKKDNGTDKNYNENLPEALKNLGTDLTEKIRKSKFQKIIGRDEETERVIEILCRKTKNNPVLIGEPGVGKSSVVEGLAQRIISNDIPELLKEKIIFSLDLASLMAGTKFRGSMEQKLKDAISAVLENDNIILFIDEIHMLAEAGSKDGEISPSDILKPYLARGELHCIGATTLDEYRKYIEKDPALERRFQTVSVDEPTQDDTIKILHGIRSSFENFHGVKISDEAIEAAVLMSVRYITNRFLPDKAIDLIDEACSKLRVNSCFMSPEIRDINIKLGELENEKKTLIKKQDYIGANQINEEIQNLKKRIFDIKSMQIAQNGASFSEISAENIRDVVSKWTKIPVSKISSTEREKLLKLESILSERVIGQEDAVSVVAKAIRRAKADINDPNRPIGSFLFLGPTGVGKTELTKALGDILFDSEDSIIRFDMSEFMESHSVSRLIGAPPGYVGHEDGGELTEAVKRKPYSIVLFDEIEKAHPDVFNILLQILDDGRLTDSSGKNINFKNTLIILTSNNGVQKLLDRRKFEEEHPEEMKVDTQKFLLDKLRDNFKPELLNRIDSIVVFNSLSKEAIMKIADIMLSSLIKRFAAKDISLEISISARELVAEKRYDKLNGARPLRRVIDKEIKDPLAEMIISGEINPSSAVRVDADGEKFRFDIICS